MNRKKYVSISPMTWTMVYPLLIPIFCFLNGICNLVTTPEWPKHEIITNCFDQFALIFVGLCNLAFKLNSEGKTENINTPIRYSPSKMPLITQSTNNEPLLFIIIIGILNSFFYLFIRLSFRQIGIIEYKTSVQLLQIVLAALLSKYILKYEYHYHHYISYLFSLFGFFFVFFFSKNTFSFSWAYLVFSITFLLMTMLDVFEKWLMDIKYVNPFRLVFIEGISGVISAFGMLCLSLLIPCNWFMNDIGLCEEQKHIDSFETFFLIFSSGSWIYFVLFMLTSAGFFTFAKITVYHYSPTHKTMADVIGIFFYFIFSVFNSVPFHWAQLMGYIIVIISCIWFNEIIIVHIFNLDQNTKLAIIQRTRQEYSRTGQIVDVDETEENSLDI